MIIPAISLLLSPPEIPADIAAFSGPQLLGIMLNWGLFGVLLVQVYVYHLCFPNDSRKFKCLVLGIFILEAVQTGMATYDGFQWFSLGWGNVDNLLLKPYGSPIDSPAIDSIVSLAVQLFFAWRITVLAKGRIIPGIIAVLSVVQTGAGLWSGIKAVLINDLPEVRRILAPELAVWLIGSALVDTLIAATMTVLLLRSYRRDYSSRTRDMIKRIVMLTIESNTLTAAVAILTIILFLAFPNNNYFICPPYTLGKLYSNTLLAVFNNRAVMSEQQQHTHTSQFFNSDESEPGSGSPSAQGNTQANRKKRRGASKPQPPTASIVANGNSTPWSIELNSVTPSGGKSGSVISACLPIQSPPRSHIWESPMKSPAGIDMVRINVVRETHRVVDDVGGKVDDTCERPKTMESDSRSSSFEAGKSCVSIP